MIYNPTIIKQGGDGFLSGYKKLSYDEVFEISELMRLNSEDEWAYLDGIPKSMLLVVKNKIPRNDGIIAERILHVGYVYPSFFPYDRSSEEFNRYLFVIENEDSSYDYVGITLTESVLEGSYDFNIGFNSGLLAKFSIGNQMDYQWYIDEYNYPIEFPNGQQYYASGLISFELYARY